MTWQLKIAMGTCLLLPSLTSMARASSVTFRTEDRWNLVGEYFPPKDDGHVVILIHSLNGSRNEWKDLGERLRGLGLGTLAFDLRGYGESTQSPYGRQDYGGLTERDWRDTVKDVDAAVAFLEEKEIPEDRVALVGSVVGANIASMASMTHPAAAWMILLSPSNDYHGLSAGSGGGMDTLLIAGTDDPDAMAICRRLAGESSHTFYIARKGGRGIAVFKDQKFLEQVLGWVRREEKNVAR